jgi:predicted LPLAT superfamily acyltransferase
LLASLLNAPVYMVFAFRQKDLSLLSHYDLHIRRCDISFAGSRREREAGIQELGRRFAGLLEEYCKQHPYQWYNFFDFWAKPGGEA